MKLRYKLLSMLGLISLVSYTEASADLIVTEFMQSNIDCIKDDINEYPDSWVELYNSGESHLALKEYSIGVTDNPNNAYKLPDEIIEPGEFLVIYCDKVNGGLHTDFRLDSGKGGGIYLFHEENIVDKVENIKKQPAPNIAYGRQTEDSEQWGYQAVPTPGNYNCGKLVKELLPSPCFSVEGKVFTDSFDLTLSIPEQAPDGARIHYTLDCSEPTESSPIYFEPLEIETTTVVRAKLICDGYISQRSTTQSYIAHPREVTLPIVSIVSDDKYFYDDYEGILVEGNYTPGTPNYNYDWRRPTNFEYFEEPDRESLINQLCETRIKGGGSRKLPLKSMVFYANKRFGEKRFNYEFFPDQTPGIEEFKSFELRNSGDDFNTTYMRDAIIQQCMGMNCDLDWQPSRPAIVYINAQYKGILNIRTRSNEDYVYSYYDGLEDLDMLENWQELKEGSKGNFEIFKKFYFEEGHSYEEFEKFMDVEEFCNLMIMNIFFDNKDFPANNIVMWRPTEEGGKWRWIAKDTDFGLGLYNEPFDYKTLYWITTPGYDNNHNSWANSEAATILFRRLLDTQEFKNMFIDRCAIYLGDFLTSDQINKRIEARYNELAYEYDFHRKNLGDHNSTFSENVLKAKDWISNRIPAYYNQLSSYFELEEPISLTITLDDDISGSVCINGISLKNRDFVGQYFPDRELKISVLDTENDQSLEWEVKVNNNGTFDSNSYHTSVLDIPFPNGDSVEIQIHKAGSTVNEIRCEFDNSQPIDWYDITGRFIFSQNSFSMSDIPSGVYILRQGIQTKKTIVR